MSANPKILYPIIDGQVTGGNIVCLHLIEAALNQGWDVLVNSPSEGRFCDILREKGVTVYHLDTTRSFNWLSAVKMAQLIKKEEVSLVHAHAPFAGSIISALAGKLAGVPVIIHAHLQDALSSNSLIRSYQNMMNYWTSRKCCNAMIAVSYQVKDALITEGFDSRKFYVVHNGTLVNNREIDSNIRNELNIPEDIPVVIHIGRLCKSKGQHLLLQAAANLQQLGQEAVYLIVGKDLEQNGAYLDYLKDMAQELGINNSVHFLGHRSDIPQLLALSDLLVLPSYTEGLPLVILEAMAAGLPVIATPVGGIPEVVIHQETGLLVPVGDVQALVNAMLKLLQNPDLRNEMGNKGSEMVRKDFSVEKMCDEVFDIYEKVGLFCNSYTN
ncbi:glycosyltransferase family 4 protein [Rivularia sp. UHCC 0363]|uniref:glycosyltransferase family 4 protein n=1 Tax=Rivularia sp. UHCC 0363 TaxID=3110244 RepID=UPI002B2181C7|nr:glycosyltransferase family 4 protein [Rivularia sp. UHCC 0363]MEA5593446.1 glycosyltransferase family 4 protein [Rivularia sp. UHCC 0363]